MSHKNCDCNECTTIGYWSDDKTFEETPAKSGDDKLLKQPIELMPRVEACLFVPEEDDFSPYFEDDHSDDIVLGFQTKDSGQRQEFSTGMQRDVNTGKPRYDLIWQPGLKRVAELMARGAAKYSPRNWEKASTQEEMDRFDESLLRHVFQLLEGDRSEDHMAALVFNVFGREMVREKLKK